MIVTPLEAAVGPVEDDFGHASLPARTVGSQHNLALCPDLWRSGPRQAFSPGC